jgi:hypothetical protein
MEHFQQNAFNEHMPLHSGLVLWDSAIHGDLSSAMLSIPASAVEVDQ